jgi:hypothetical protein
MYVAANGCRPCPLAVSIQIHNTIRAIKPFNIEPNTTFGWLEANSTPKDKVTAQGDNPFLDITTQAPVNLTYNRAQTRLLWLGAVRRLITSSILTSIGFFLKKSSHRPWPPPPSAPSPAAL